MYKTAPAFLCNSCIFCVNIYENVFTIRAGQDPNAIDETTGKYTITDEADRQPRLAAEATVLEKHNVKIVHVQYAQDSRSELVLSVLAGNPVCEIARMWSGSENTMLAQNIHETSTARDLAKTYAGAVKTDVTLPM